MSTSRARSRKTYHHGDLRRALLREGRRALDAEGPAALSLRGVARRAGVSQAAPYRHFDGKEGLLAALAAEGWRGLERASKRRAARQRDPLKRFVAMCEAYVRFGIDNPQLYRVMLGSVRKRWSAEVAEAGDHAFARLVDVVRECQQTGRMRPGEPAAMGATAASLCHGIVSLALDARTPPGVSVEGFTRRALALLVEGLEVRPK